MLNGDTKSMDMDQKNEIRRMGTGKNVTIQNIKVTVDSSYWLYSIIVVTDWL
ncbi:hypothetical protein K7432_017430, partial [Basidiobolus ranarum]